MTGRGATLLTRLGLGALAMHTLPAATSLPALREHFCPSLAGKGAPGHVALTFDDGPHPESTPRFLHALAQREVRATFFVLGRELDRYPLLGRDIVEAGHEIAVHGWEHRCLLWRTPTATHRELAETKKLITFVTGVVPRWYRPPYGVLTWPAMVAAWQLDLFPVLWTCWGRDWTGRATPHSVFGTVTRALRGGGTVLLHDSDVEAASNSWRSTLGTLPMLLDECCRLGLAV
ncbi:MAG: polysaccharide deacetylase family protein, partial [Sciscionella sp.]